MIRTSKEKMYTEKTYKKKGKKVEAIIIFGAGLYQGNPGNMLRERLDTGISLYKQGFAKKIIMTGDHGEHRYNEVQAMKNYAIEKGVPSGDIFMDHAGFSTYESIARMKEVFQVSSGILVSQAYHLPRALYLSQAMGLDMQAVASDKRRYKGQRYRDVREYMARVKDFWKGIFKPKTYIGGEVISLNQSGDVTND